MNSSRIASALTAALIGILFLSGCGDSSAPPTKTTPADSKSAVEPKLDESKKAAAVDVPVPVPGLDESIDKDNSGWMLTLESTAKPGVTDRRITRIPNIYVPAGTPPSAFLPAGPFKATWTGNLKIPLKNEYAFYAEGCGNIKIVVNDTDVFSASGDDFKTGKGKEIKLKQGQNKFTVTYESPASGDAVVRLLWKTVEVTADDGFFEESLPPMSLSFDNTDKTFREARRKHLGRELYATQRCEACHGGEHIGANLNKEGPPELTMDAPNLSLTGARLNAPWIATWLKDPRKLRNESSMPQLLRGPTADQDAEDIASFLVTLNAQDDKSAVKPDDEAVKKGGYVFTNLGCIGCHRLPNTQQMAEGRILLAYARDKFKPAALKEFLKKPDAHYAWIRMPDFRLTDKEIAELSAFIRGTAIKDDAKGMTIEPLKGKANAEHGKELVETLGCLNCHDAGTTVKNRNSAPKFQEIAGADWAKGCLAEKEADLGKAPNFHFTSGQRGALLAFAATGRDSLKQNAMPEFAERQIAALRCTACHNRDGKQSLWSGRIRFGRRTKRFPRTGNRRSQRRSRRAGRQSQTAHPLAHVGRRKA